MNQTYSFKNKELLTIAKNADTIFCSSVLWNSVQNFKTNEQAVLVLALEEHNLWFLLISLLVHHQNSLHSSFNLAKARALFIGVTFFLLQTFLQKISIPKEQHMLFYSYWWTRINTRKDLFWSLFLVKLQTFSPELY